VFRNSVSIDEGSFGRDLLSPLKLESKMESLISGLSSEDEAMKIREGLSRINVKKLSKSLQISRSEVRDMINRVQMALDAYWGGDFDDE
jgi:hypothetical protein